MSWTADPSCDTEEKTFQSRSDAENAKATHIDYCDECEQENVLVYNSTAEVVEQDDEPQANADVVDVQDGDDPLDQLGDSLGTDPLEILPGHMIDHIQGQPAINKRGYAMIAERYGIEVKAFIESYPWENEEGRCVARAMAKTDDGKEYQDWATANKADGDMSEQLVELASTRALKRVVGWASGLGIVSYQELAGELE